MGQYIPNSALTQERIAELKASLDFAEYELAAAVALARTLGLSWDAVGRSLGYAEGGTKQGGRQWAMRHNIETLMLDEGERARIGKLIGAGERVTRFAVREIVSGRVGITKVTRRTLSTHLKREVAEERARKREGAEVWQLAPDGTERQLAIRPRPSTFGRSKRDEIAAGLDDW